MLLASSHYLTACTPSALPCTPSALPLHPRAAAAGTRSRFPTRRADSFFGYGYGRLKWLPSLRGAARAALSARKCSAATTLPLPPCRHCRRCPRWRRAGSEGTRSPGSGAICGKGQSPAPCRCSRRSRAAGRPVGAAGTGWGCGAFPRGSGKRTGAAGSPQQRGGCAITPRLLRCPPPPPAFARREGEAAGAMAQPEPWHSRGVLGREGAGLRPASPLEMGKKLNKNKHE